ncbi:MAG: hemerythrin domain-containing protein [Pirellulales bacterium]|nr:hemerythrin domain-containing protein [Pirellulales bacterium]
MTVLRDSVSSSACMEHQVFEHIKQALLVTIHWQAPAVSMPQKLSSLQFTMKSFQRHFERVVAIEETGGYMADATLCKPYVQDRVEHLAKEHHSLRHRIGNLDAMLSDIKEWEDSKFDLACDELLQLIEDLDRHNQTEIELLQESMLFDEGGEG